ncbi:MAG: dethiobiotin synthase [Akkermansia sp.]|nr:dethiobiotin synthase [Akkermansia sp.]
MKQHYFIAGTDAAVGKTYVTCALLRSLCAAGVNAVGFKPIACGDRAEARNMRDAIAAPTLNLESINPVYLRTGTDPQMAASLERKEIDVNEICSAWQQLAQQYDVVLTEGVYGWLTPVAAGVTMADVAVKLNLPVILVTENRKGAAGVVALTAKAIEQSGLKCVGVILNHPGEEWDTAAVTNADLIERTTGLPVLASLIHGDEPEWDMLAL